MKSFENRKKCLADICEKHQQISNYKTQIEQTTKDDELENLIQQIQQANIEEVNRKIVECSNIYTSDKPYEKPI